MMTNEKERKREREREREREKVKAIVTYYGDWRLTPPFTFRKRSEEADGHLFFFFLRRQPW